MSVSGFALLGFGLIAGLFIARQLRFRALRRRAATTPCPHCGAMGRSFSYVVTQAPSSTQGGMAEERLYCPACGQTDVTKRRLAPDAPPPPPTNNSFG